MTPSACLNKKEPNVLLDLSSIKTGGGAQLALNFIKAVNDGKFGLKIGVVLVPENGPFNRRLDPSYDVVSAPNGAFRRILNEYWNLRKTIRAKGVTHVYTFFGPGLPRYSGVRRVVGMAYPTLVYNDSVYWRQLATPFRIKKKLQNSLRARRLRTADHLIFETEVMASRAKVSGLTRNESSVLGPTPTAFLSPTPTPDFADKGVQILFLAGPDPHKNLWRLLDVLEALERERLPARFHLSMDRETFLANCPGKITSVTTSLVDKYFYFLGNLKPDDLQCAYDNCNVVGNISDLESFSNNYMEAWVVGRPIIASDRDFSRHICGASALYVEPHDPASLLAGIRAFAFGEVDVEAMIRAGHVARSRLPTMNNRLISLAKIIAPTIKRSGEAHRGRPE